MHQAGLVQCVTSVQSFLGVRSRGTATSPWSVSVGTVMKGTSVKGPNVELVVINRKDFAPNLVNVGVNQDGQAQDVRTA